LIYSGTFPTPNQSFARISNPKASDFLVIIEVVFLPTFAKFNNLLKEADWLMFAYSTNAFGSVNQNLSLLKKLDTGAVTVGELATDAEVEIDLNWLVSTAVKFNKFNTITGPLSKHVRAVLWKKDPFLSNAVSISPNTVLKKHWVLNENWSVKRTFFRKSDD